MSHELSNQDGKANDVIIENSASKVLDEVREGDYSGAVAKTDPEEIRLVRKLDIRIMPIMWAMYFLNYVSIHHTVLPRQIN